MESGNDAESVDNIRQSVVDLVDNVLWLDQVNYSHDLNTNDVLTSFANRLKKSKRRTLRENLLPNPKRMSIRLVNVV